MLVCGASLFAHSKASPSEQTAEPPASNTSAQALTKADTVNAGGGLEVLSDTMGVNFQPYLDRVLHDIKQNWYYHIPDSAKAPILRKGKVLIEFAILKDGHIQDMKLVEASGDVAMDRGAWAGVSYSNPLPPLPPEFLGQYLTLRFKFLYNTGPDNVKAQETTSDKPANLAAPTSTDTDMNRIFKVGDGVSPPVAIEHPAPKYSEQARREKYEGTCVLWLVVDADGRPRDIKVHRTLGLGLDEEAIEAVTHWRFKPAMKDGKPVSVRISVQVDFHLHDGRAPTPNP